MKTGKVYISFVGDRDPYWAKDKKTGGIIRFNELLKSRGQRFDLRDGPILSFFSEEFQPWSNDHIYLISTAGGEKVKNPTMAGGGETAKILIEKHGLKDKNICHWPLSGINPIAIEEVITPLREMVLKIIEENGPDAEYIINFSPGTPQMRAALFTLVSSGVIKAKLYSPIEGTSEVKEVTFTPFFEEELKNRGIKLFEKYSFKPSSDIFDELSRKTVNPKRKTICDIFRDLLKIYSDWSVFKYKDALNGIRELNKSPILKGWGFQGLATTLFNQEKELEKLLERSTGVRAIDLYHNAELKMEMGDYLDSLWLFNASCEVAVIDRAVKIIERITHKSIDPNEFYKAMQDKEISKLLDPFFSQYSERIPEYLDERVSLKMLEWFEDEKGQKGAKFKSTKGIKELKSMRDKSLHIGKPGTHEKAKKGQDIAQEVIIEYFGHDKIDIYPFSKKVFSGIVKLAERSI